jgi:quercetin dioxygenase-like cupin family protein
MRGPLQFARRMYFTGPVWVDPLFSPPDPARVAGALVTFEPSARMAWHTHPLGRTDHEFAPITP